MRISKLKLQAVRISLRWPPNTQAVRQENKEYIKAGDIVQAVVSQRWHTKIHTTPLEIYRALRVINPSPYMFYLRVAGVAQNLWGGDG